MATVNLGSIKFKWKGTYSGATAYTVDDVVEYNGSSYICILASTGNLPTNATYFEQMSAKGTNGTNGTNGTDLTTTLTTQGDLVYRDGSGLQRLGAGTAGQVLQTGGAGANPSWGTLSSDFVKLASSTNVDASSVDFNGYFSSTYKNYKIILNDVEFGSNNADRVALRFATTGSYTVDSANYSYATLLAYSDYNEATGNGNAAGTTGVFNSDKMRIGRGTSGTGSTNMHSQYEITLFNPLGNGFKTVFCNFFNYEADGYRQYMPGFTGGHWEDTSQITGITFLTEGGNNLIASNIALYGIK
jgi:hypothetical protein